MNSLNNLLLNLLDYSIHSYIIFSDDQDIPKKILTASKKYTNSSHILLLEENNNKAAVQQAQLFFRSVSILPKIAIFNFDQTEYTINASLKFIEELYNNQYLFIISNNQKLPITLLSRCLQIHTYKFNTEQYEEFLIKIHNKENNIADQYTPHQIYDFIKHLCNKYIKYKYNYKTITQLTAYENNIYSKTTQYTNIFAEINKHYNLYVNSNLKDSHINFIILNYFL